MRAERCPLGVSHLHQVVAYLSFLLLLLPTAHGLYYVEGSNCTAACFSNSTGSGATTNGGDIVCHDSDYSLVNRGIGFENCIACELQSPTVDRTTAHSDLGWALFNLRFSLSWCLYGFPNGNNTDAAPQCNDACSRLSNSIETNINTPNESSAYDYCQDKSFLSNVAACASCYDVIQNQRYMSNYLNVLQYACQYMPNTSNAFPIPPPSIFSLNAPSNYSSFASNSNAPAAGLNSATKTAIAISVPVCFFLIFSLILVCCYTYKQTKDLPPPSRTHSKRSTKQISKYTDSEKGWSHTSRSPPKRTFSEKRSASTRTARTHGHSRGPSSHSRAINPQPAPLQSEKLPVTQPLRTRSAHSQLGRLYSQAGQSPHVPLYGQAKTSPQAPNPTTDTLVTTYTTPSSSLHSIPILSPSRYEPPVPVLGPMSRWDDAPPVPTLLPPRRSSPLARSRPTSRSSDPSRSAPPSHHGRPSRSGPPSRRSPPQSALSPDRKPSLPPPSRWEQPHTRNLPPLSRYALQSQQYPPPSSPPPTRPIPLPPNTHYEAPPRLPSLPPPEEFQALPPRFLPLEVPISQPMEEAGPSRQQIQEIPPPPSTSTPSITGVYIPPGLMSWERVALQNARMQEMSSEQTAASASPVSPLTMPHALGGTRRSKSGSSRGSGMSSAVQSPVRSEPSHSEGRLGPSGRALSRIPSADEGEEEEERSRPGTAGKGTWAARSGSPGPGPSSSEWVGRSRGRFPVTATQPSPVPSGYSAELEAKLSEQERARQSLRRSMSSEKARREREKKRREKEVKWSGEIERNG